jgi:hypothetical protein
MKPLATRGASKRKQASLPKTASVTFAPSGVPDRELEWYFTIADSDMGVRSNYAAMIGRARRDDMDECVEAARAHTRVTGWLRGVGDHDAGVLEAAYEAGPWPVALRERFGRATGVMLRLGCAAVGMPDDALHGQALTLLERAYRAYIRERGGLAVPYLGRRK